MSQISKVPTVTGMMGVLVTILVAVIVFDTADLNSANIYKDGGWAGHEPRIVIVFDVADLTNANSHRDGACLTLTPQGGGGRSE